jgi:hypothetical protein
MGFRQGRARAAPFMEAIVVKFQLNLAHLDGAAPPYQLGPTAYAQV